MLIGTLFSCVVPKNWGIGLLGAVSKSMVIGLSQLHTPQFSLAAADYGSTLLIVLMLQSRALLSDPQPASRWMIAGILVSGLAIGVLSSFTLSAFFNHNESLPPSAISRVRLALPRRKTPQRSVLLIQQTASQTISQLKQLPIPSTHSPIHPKAPVQSSAPAPSPSHSR